MSEQILYKLTDQNGYTRFGQINQTLWAAGLVVEAKEEGTQLCTAQVIHAYTHPLLASLLNSIHADIDNPLLWECKGKVVAEDHGLKVGVKRLTCVRQVELPVVTIEQRVRFAILCALEACHTPEFVSWATRWLNGSDRTQVSASKAASMASEWAAAAWLAARAAWAGEDNSTRPNQHRRAGNGGLRVTADFYHELGTTTEFAIIALESQKERHPDECSWLIDKRIKDLRRLREKAQREFYATSDATNSAQIMEERR